MSILVGDSGDEDAPDYNLCDVDSGWNRAGTLDRVGASFGIPRKRAINDRNERKHWNDWGLQYV